MGMCCFGSRSPSVASGQVDLKAEQADSFGGVADVYARSRPSYPDRAVDWLLDGAGRRVVDLGAGAGQLTRQLLSRALEVIAVEPSAGMRTQLTRSLQGADALDGAAERIPLPSASVDAVLVAQAWHWADPTLAVPEVARVLRPGGRLGLVWNIRDERVPWVAELGRIMHRGIGQDMASDNPPVGSPFAPVDRLDVEWTHVLGPDDLLDLVTTRSYIITLSEPERARVIDEVRDLLARHPDLAGRGEIALPYVARSSRTQLV